MICSGVCRSLPILTSSLKSFRPGRSYRSLRKDGTVGGRLPAGQVPRIYKAMAGRAGFSAQMVRADLRA